MRFPRKMLVFVATVVLVILAGCVFLTQPMVKPFATTPPPVDARKLRAHVKMLSEDLYLRSFDHPKMLAADDNASGVAGLIELARLLTIVPPKTGVELVAYTLEEPPNFRTQAMGSAHHARRMRDSGRQVKVMISLEMIGYFDSRPGTQTYPVPGLGLLYPNRGDFIAVVGRVQDWAVTRRVKAGMLGATDLPVRSINAPALVPGIDFSDHRSYWAQGFPAVMVTDTAFFRNPHYHQAGDVASTLDYERMAKVIQGIFGAIQGYGAKQ